MKLRSNVFAACALWLPAIALSACTTWAEPPEHLTIDQDVKVSFQSSEEASRSCSDIHEEIRGKKNKNIKACAYRKTAEAAPVVIIPNPCEFDDIYASLLCHELAHINQMAKGFSVDHKGWGGALQLAKSTQSFPKVPESREGTKNPASERSEPLKAPRIRARVNGIELVTFYDRETPKLDVKSLKLRGLSTLEPAS